GAPSASVAGTAVAWPGPCRVPVPRVLAPSLKVTVPVGVPAPGLLAVTVAVKVTDCPDSDGLAEELTSVAVLAFFTVWVSVLEVLPLKVALPPYDAVIGCAPTASVLVTNVAWPEPSRVPVPSALGPSLKVTVPVGMPAPAVLAFTVAVKVTGCPDTEGLAEEVTPVVVPGIVAVVVVDVDVVVVVVVVGSVVVVEPGLVVVVEAPAGLKVASTMFQLLPVPRVRPASCGPAALDRM